MTVYRKILITTDDSAVSRHTACEGVQFARQMGAEILALYVAPAYQYPVYVEILAPAYPSLEDYVEQMRRVGAGHLSEILAACRENGVVCSGRTEFADAVARKICDVAEEQRCDLIFMGSHGRSGWGRLLLGSVTSKVLSHTLKPVLVHRLIKEPAS